MRIGRSSVKTARRYSGVYRGNGSGHGIIRDIARYRDMYALLIPGFAFLFVFHLLPLGGEVIAFKDYQIFSGANALDAIFKSNWVGFTFFRQILGDPYFLKVLGNTVIISFYKIFFLFPLPIVLAVLLNEVRNIAFKRSIQTVVYIPHFISWPIIYGLFFALLNSQGIVSAMIGHVSHTPIHFFTDNRYFRAVLVASQGWQEVGWGTIVYLATIAGIDPQLYEAATMDGAGAFRQMLSITLPGIAATIVILLILRIGKLMDAGFEQILAMYNPTVYDSSDIIQTYVYRTGLGQFRFSYATAFGLFQAIANFCLILGSNFLSRRFTGRSIW